MDPTIAERASRITPQEWRVIALSIEGVPPAAACEALGIALGTLESHKQAIRRKLGIPKGQRFEAFVRESFGADVPMPEPAAPREPKEPVEKSVADRRVRWLLRITLQELQELSMSAGLRAQLLEQTVKRVGGEDVGGEAAREVADLQQLSSDLQELFKKSLEQIRARGADTSSFDQ